DLGLDLHRLFWSCGLSRNGLRERRLGAGFAGEKPQARPGRLDRLGELFACHAAACCCPSTMSSSSAIAAISRAAGPFQLIKLGVAPHNDASGYATRFCISF